MRKNRVKEKLRQGETSIGAWLMIESSLSAEVAAHSGVDWLVVDLEHSAVGITGLMHMFQAISTTDTVPFVRVPDHNPATTKRVLDLGAYGVVFPQVNNAEQARRCVAACKYPPEGNRGFGPLRATVYGGSDYFNHANNEIVVVLMLEQREALENLEEILDIPGIDVAFIGPGDLAASLGMAPGANIREPEHMAAVEAIVKAATQRGISTGIICENAKEARDRVQQGMSWIAVGTDITIMAAAFNKEVNEMR